MKKGKQLNKKLTIILIILIITFVVSGLVLKQIKQSKGESKGNNQAQILPIPTDGGWIQIKGQVNQDNNWLSYKQTSGYDFWHSFVLYYPSASKLLKMEYKGSPSITLKIEDQNGSYLQITQGEGDSGICLFPDQKDYTKPATEVIGNRYATFSDIEKQGDLKWRLGSQPDDYNHSLCEYRTIPGSNSPQKYYRDGTSIGWVSIKASSPESLQEIIKILEKIEISE